MIHPAFYKSEIARRYYEKKGETLTAQQATNRWRMTRNFDKKLLRQVFDEIYREQREALKAS